jgi:hypothetical protein
VIIDTRKNSRVVDKYLPLFDKTTAKPTMIGTFSCASCHNVHQWDSKSPENEADMKTEGSVLDSFLRTSSLHLLCRDCHGPEALFKYLYFHDPTKRTGKKD